MTTGRVLGRLAGHRSCVNELLALPDGTLVSGSNDGFVRVWGADDESELRAFPVHREVRCMAQSPGGEVLAAGCADGQVVVLTSQLIRLFSFAAGSAPVTAVGYSPDGRHLACGCGVIVSLHCAATGAVVVRLVGHRAGIFAVCFSLDTALFGKRLFTGSLDSTLRVWRPHREAERRVGALLAGMEVRAGDWEMGEVVGEIVRRVMR
jgi:WD40 repeat protein